MSVCLRAHMRGVAHGALGDQEKGSDLLELELGFFEPERATSTLNF